MSNETTLIHELIIGNIDEIKNPGCREFSAGDSDWPFKGFIVRQGEDIFAYQNYCMHAGHPLNWQPDSFLTADKSKIICASHGAIYDIASGECVAGPCRGKKLNSIKCGVHEGLITVFIPINVL